MPGQSQRVKSVRQKLNPIELEFKDKNVLLVEDSIVRGTTMQHVIQMAREAGARKVYMASAAPPIRFPNVYGIDMPSARELVAHDRSVEEVERAIGADWLSINVLTTLLRVPGKEIRRFPSSSARFSMENT
jgi:amidophosphoribosyltransferase